VSSSLRAPKGVAEYVAPAAEAFLSVREALIAPARLAGYGYLELPIFEDTELFVRGVGESTDVVSKEMFTFTDRGGRSLTLRPEGTAGAIRSIIQHGLDRAGLPVKVWYAGPCFRAERPQQGRFRQFSQVGVEAVGSEDPALDAEVVAIADAGFRGLGLRNQRLLLNSLGCRTCRPHYREVLTNFLQTLALDPATAERAQLNPLRVLDDKRPEVQELLAPAPLPIDHLCQECRDHYDQVREDLRVLGVAWQEVPRLVRGLDYYTRTAFEFVHDDLGAQSGIGGGGRYDGLMADLGGADRSGIGFGLGIDRTMLALTAEGLAPVTRPRCEVFAIPLGPTAKTRLLAIVAQLRAGGVAADICFDDRPLRGAMKSADRSGARLALILGDAELSAGEVLVKDLASGEQQAIQLDSAVAAVLADLRSPAAELLGTQPAPSRHEEQK
jgi:histidyl-tRNA synthetase